MQAMSQSVSLSFRIACAVLFLVGAAFLANPARAETVKVEGNAPIPRIVSVVAKGAGQGEVTITGVQLKSSLSYCLIGVGRGNWYGTATKVQLEKIGCTKPVSGSVTVPIRLDAKRYEANGSVIGYIPIVTDANGVIIDWPQKPVGALTFERTSGKPDEAIAVFWATNGQPKLATAEQAMTIND